MSDVDRGHHAALEKVTSVKFKIVLGYLLLWCLADYFAGFFETLPGISAWYPPHAFSLVLLVRYGFHYWPCLLVGPAIMGSLFWMQGEPGALTLLSVTITLGYTLQAWILRYYGFDGRFLDLKKTLVFLLSGLACSFMVAFMGLVNMSLFHLVEPDLFWRRMLDFWAGDTLAVICMAPFLFTLCYLYDVVKQKGGLTFMKQWRQPDKTGELFLQHLIPMLIYAVVTCMAPFDFGLFDMPPIYFLFIPLFGIAIQYGSVGVALYLFLGNVVIITLIRVFQLDIQMTDLQLMMSVLSASGLCFGALIYSDRVNAVLRQRNDELENFSYMLSHDFQSPLRLVLSKTQELSSNKTLNRDDRERLSLIMHLGEHMFHLIRSLTSYLVVGESLSLRRKVSLENVVSQAVTNLLSFQEERHAVIDVSSLPKVRGDEQMLVDLFQNLIANAIAYTVNAPPSIRVYSDQRSDGEVIVYIEDNGPGIPQSVASRIFEPFVKFGQSNAKGHHHTGLGLAIAHKIAHAHQMRLYLDRSDHTGSRFALRIDNGTGF